MSVIDSLQTSTAGATATAAAAAAAATKKDDPVSEDRFLKLLVAQMKNQDPLNPLDNAQVTSQMAQISTVSGIDKLNTTVAGLNTQLVQLQAMQGASLVGREVTVPGDRLSIAAGVGNAGFELASTAARVKVEVLNPAGLVVDTLELGAQSAGSHAFEWAAKGVAGGAQGGVPDGAAYRFRVVATQGTTAVAATPLMRDRVEAVTAGGSTLQLELERGGVVAYDKVRAFH